jgi:hypothetical protein
MVVVQASGNKFAPERAPTIAVLDVPPAVTVITPLAKAKE